MPKLAADVGIGEFGTSAGKPVAGDVTSAEAIYGEDINENARPEAFFDPSAIEDEEDERGARAEDAGQA